MPGLPTSTPGPTHARLPARRRTHTSIRARHHRPSLRATCRCRCWAHRSAAPPAAAVPARNDMQPPSHASHAARHAAAHAQSRKSPARRFGSMSGCYTAAPHAHHSSWRNRWHGGLGSSPPGWQVLTARRLPSASHPMHVLIFAAIRAALAHRRCMEDGGRPCMPVASV
jgi:hypothetical protein